MISKTYYDRYVQILKEELIPAMGCTEPIAIAYASAIAAKHLGVRPDAVQVEVSGNIIKNAKSVVVPNTGGLRGIPAAAAAGIVAGDPSRELKVIAQASLQDIERIRQFLRDVPITVSQANTGNIFDIRVTVFNGTQSSSVHICDFHTNVREIRKNGDIVFTRDITAMTDSLIANRSFMNVADIIEFADTVRIADVQEILDKQIEYNTAISEEGLQGDYGANIGRVLLRTYGDTDVKIRARAKAAAASDARMDGCELPVVVNSGSGNQGIAASVPVIEYAAELGASRELLYRALIVSNLTTIHMKTGIGRLSAYCGAVSAGCGSG